MFSLLYMCEYIKTQTFSYKLNCLITTKSTTHPQDIPAKHGRLRRHGGKKGGSSRRASGRTGGEGADINLSTLSTVARRAIAGRKRSCFGWVDGSHSDASGETRRVAAGEQRARNSLRDRSVFRALQACCQGGHGADEAFGLVLVRSDGDRRREGGQGDLPRTF